MKKIISIFLCLLPLLADAQTKQSASPSIRVFGIPLGITIDEFQSKAQLVNETLSQSLNVDKAVVFCNMYGGTKGKIVWRAYVKIKNLYASPSIASSKIIAVLSAKYGAPKESLNCDGDKSLRWDFNGGYIQVWSKLLYGDEDKTFYMEFVDYSAMKQVEPELYNSL